MILKKNRYLLHLLTLIILASCSTTSKNLILNSNEFLEADSLKSFEDIYDYQSYFVNDLEKIQKAIDGQKLNQEQLKNAKILKRNYQKILSKKEYTLTLKPNQKYSKELIELVYKLNLPINIFWADSKQVSLPENLLSQQINGFCSSLYEDAISSLNAEISKNNDSFLIIYSQEYESLIQDLAPDNTNFMKVKYDSSDYQEFSAEILGINLSDSPLQLLDYEDSWALISAYTISKIKQDESGSLERYLELGTLNEWLLLQVLKQAGVESARINSITGKIIYKSNACTKREIPVNKITTDLFLS